MKAARCIALSMCVASGFAFASCAIAADYPSRPIRFVVGFLPGGPSDTIARVVGGNLGDALSEPVVVDNRAGAGGNVSAEIVADAQPDGHTIWLGTGGPLVIAPIIGQKVRFDPDKSFAAVSKLGNSMSILAAHPSLPANSVKELVALAKAKPGEINYASSGVATANHLAAELLSSMAKISMTHVPYKGSGAALPALISGEVKLGFGPLLPAIPHVKAGRLKALGVSGARRSTAAPIVARLNQEILKVVALPDVKDRLARDGVEAEGSTPAELDALVRNERKVWTKVIKEANIKVQ